MKEGKKQLGKELMMRYLLGEKLDCRIENYSTIQALINGTTWNKNYIDYFIMSESFGITRLNELTNRVLDTTRFEREIRNLYHECVEQKDESLSTMVKSLVSLHFFNTTRPETLFIPYSHPNYMEHYVAWPDKEKELATAIEKSNLVFISGGPGSGKTLFIKKVLKDYFYNYSDICFLDDCRDTLKIQLNKIEFISRKSTDKKSVLDYLHNKSAKSFLIIKRANISHNDAAFIRKQLSNLPLKIIILTRTANLPEGFEKVLLEPYPFDNLKRIYQNNIEKMDFTDEELEQLFNIAYRNPYVISLIGKIQNKSDELKHQLLNPTEWIWKMKGLKKVHSSYHAQKKSEQNIKALISLLFDYYPANTNDFLSKLAIWTKIPISEDILLKYSGIDEDDFYLAQEYGILQSLPENETIFYMHPLIADSIWERYPLAYGEYKEKLQEFLNIIKAGNPLSIPYKTFYPVIRTLIQRFHFQISLMKSREKPRNNPDFMEWHLLVTELTYYLTELGDYKITEEFLPYLYYFNQNKLLKDAAKENERLIRDVMYFKIHFIKDGLTKEALECLQKISVQIHTLLSNLESTDNFQDCTSGIYFATLAIQSFLDQQIRSEKCYTLEYLIDQKNCYNISLDTIINLVDTFSDLFQIIFEKTGIIPICNYYHYYRIMSVLLKGVHGNFSDNGPTIMIEHLNALSAQSTTYDLLLKTNCQKLYYSLIYLLQDESFARYFWTHNQLAGLEREYNDLFNKLIGYIYSFDTLWSFFTCTMLLFPYQDLLTEETRENISTSIEHMQHFVSGQTTLPEMEHDQILELIDMFLSK